MVGLYIPMLAISANKVGVQVFPGCNCLLLTNCLLLLTNTFPKPQLLSWRIPPLRVSPDRTWVQILFHMCCSWKAMEGFVNKTENHFLTFAAAWVWRWALRFDLSEKDFSQMGHPYGFSPVCVRMCPFNSHGLEKIFPHCRQRWPEPCVRRCME